MSDLNEDLSGLFEETVSPSEDAGLEFGKPTRGREKPNTKTIRAARTGIHLKGSGKVRALAEKAALNADAAQQLIDAGVQLPKAFGGARAYVGKASTVDESAILPSYMRLDNE